jgi:hypothetical protein
MSPPVTVLLTNFAQFVFSDFTSSRDFPSLTLQIQISSMRKSAFAVAHTPTTHSGSTTFERNDFMTRRILVLVSGQRESEGASLWVSKSADRQAVFFQSKLHYALNP